MNIHAKVLQTMSTKDAFFYGRLVTKVDRGGQEKDPFILVSVDKKALKIIDIARAFH